MIIDKSFKVGIITSLIGSIIFLYLLDPILKFLSDIVFFLSNRISSYFVDNLYKEIAVGKSDYSLTQMVIITIFWIATITIILLRKIKKSKFSKNQDPENRLSHLDKDTKNSVLRNNILSITAIVAINIFGILQLVSSHIKVSSINTFDQRIRILNPYIIEKDRQLLISRFSSMETYDDYLKIMLDVETIAKTNKINLPDQLYTYTY